MSLLIIKMSLKLKCLYLCNWLPFQFLFLFFSFSSAFKIITKKSSAVYSVNYFLKVQTLLLDDYEVTKLKDNSKRIIKTVKSVLI